MSDQSVIDKFKHENRVNALATELSLSPKHYAEELIALRQAKSELSSQNDSLWETLLKIAEHLEIDLEAARRIPGKPSAVYIDAIEARVDANRGGPDLRVEPDTIKVESWSEHDEKSRWSLRVPNGVKITHIPTGISVTRDTERSQHRNRDIALCELRGRLEQYKQQIR